MLNTYFQNSLVGETGFLGIILDVQLSVKFLATFTAAIVMLLSTFVAFAEEQFFTTSGIRPA